MLLLPDVRALSRYLEFRAVDASYMYLKDKGLHKVSRDINQHSMRHSLQADCAVHGVAGPHL